MSLQARKNGFIGWEFMFCWRHYHLRCCLLCYCFHLFLRKMLALFQVRYNLPSTKDIRQVDKRQICDHRLVAHSDGYPNSVGILLHLRGIPDRNRIYGSVLSEIQQLWLGKGLFPWLCFPDVLFTAPLFHYHMLRYDSPESVAAKRVRHTWVTNREKYSQVQDTHR